MSKSTKSFFTTLVLVFLGGWIVQIFESLPYFEFQRELVIIIISLLFFVLGLCLNQTKKRNHTWIKKVLISFILLFFIITQIGYYIFPEIHSILNFFAIDGFVYYMIYVLCGYEFFS